MSRYCSAIMMPAISLKKPPVYLLPCFLFVVPDDLHVGMIKTVYTMSTRVIRSDYRPLFNGVGPILGDWQERHNSIVRMRKAEKSYKDIQEATGASQDLIRRTWTAIATADH